MEEKDSGEIGIISKEINLLLGNIQAYIEEEKQRQRYLIEYARQNGFSYRAAYFDTAKELQSALDAGKIDAMLTGSLQKIMGEKAVAKFAPEPFYFITTKGNEALMNELNSALEAIQTANADFNSRLYDKYYGEASASQLAFTRKEAAFIQANPTLRVAYCETDYGNPGIPIHAGGFVHCRSKNNCYTRKPTDASGVCR